MDLMKGYNAMKFGIALAGMALSLIGATTAQAQLTITLTTTAPVAGFPNVTNYFGTITNPTANPIKIEGDNINTPLGVTFYDVLAGSAVDSNGDPNAAALPVTIPAGGSFTNSPASLFQLQIPAGTPLTDLVFTVSDGSGNVLGSAGFTVGTADVPEPGSIALLASGLVSGGLFVARRRRK